MLDKSDKVIYVGKAKNLKKRVKSYFQRALDTKTQKLVQQICDIQVTVTRNEREALLLENNLIKELRPRYNIIFRDDKSYPYIKISIEDDFPRLSFYRGTRQEGGRYFGPFPSTRAVRESLEMLQKVFQLRSCENSYFNNRTRPCLQYQIKRCTAPCVQAISAEDYKKDVQNAQWFLQGKHELVNQQLVKRMERAAKKLDYELAGRLRDQIALLRTVQDQQIIVANPNADVDVIGVALDQHQACIHVLRIRKGVMLGSQQIFYSLDDLPEVNQESISFAWLTQHYLSKRPENGFPKEVLVECKLNDESVLTEELSEVAGHRVKLVSQPKADRRKWLIMATNNAKQGLLKYGQRGQRFLSVMVALQQGLQLATTPERIECFDVSHTQGVETLAACVVFGQNGEVKSDYRRFNIKQAKKSDDYGAMQESLQRHFTRKKEKGLVLPDILLIDGGKGQLAVAVRVLQALQIEGICCLGIVKGEGRKAQFDRIITAEGQVVSLEENSEAKRALQRIRDEAHRFAISGHRQKRRKQAMQSSLQAIPGIGAKRRKQLLQHFGGQQEVLKASLDELMQVPGIGTQTAKQIYEALHGR